ncbi:MAG: CBS domain-containing protein [Pleurocapsa sp.]
MQQNNSISLEQAVETELLAVSPETPLEEVIELMSQNWTNSCLLTAEDSIRGAIITPVVHSCVLAIANSQIQGIFTEQALTSLIASGRNIKGLTLGEVMSRNVITLTSTGSQDIFTLLSLFRRYPIRCLPIVDQNHHLLGLVTQGSLRRALRSTDLLKLRTVREVMSRAIHALPNASVLEVAQLMSDYQVSSIPIVDNNDLQIPLGIITAKDIVQFKLLELNLAEIPARVVMSTPLFLTQADDSLWEVQQQMNQYLVRRIVVTGEQGELLGIVTQGDLLRAINLSDLRAAWSILQNRNLELTERVESQARELKERSQKEQLVAQIALRIRQSLDLKFILQTTVEEVRQLIEADRVLIYRFESDLSGIVSTEAVSNPQWSILERLIKDSCFEQAWIKPYQQGHIFAVADVHQANLSPCHVEFLENLQVKANVAIPILLTELNTEADRLWGLLIVHQCDSIRNWQESELELLQLLTTQVAIAIQQGEIYQQAQIELEQRKQAEASLRERETQLRTALDAAAMGTWIWDITTNQVILTPRSQSILGFTPGEFPGTLDAVLERIHPDDRQKIDEPTKKAIVSGGLYEIETRIILSDHQERWLTARGHILLDPQGKPTRMVGVIADITEKKLLAEQSLRHQRLESLGSLAGGVAHDLNNILTPILMSVQLLPVTLTQIDPRSQELLQMLENNVQRGSALVQQVLSFARGIEGKHGIVQVKHLIRDIRQIATETFPKSIEIKTNVASNLWTVQGDATQIHQILLNLVINARDAMPEGGLINIAAVNLLLDEVYVREHPQAKVGPYIAISIADTGVGIPRGNLERIFQPFFTTKVEAGGTGLGLATVVNIIRNHGGFIDVVSQVEQGTQFNVFMPAIKIAESDLIESLTIPKGKGELILVVDDEATMREITQASLETHNYRVITANDGIEAIAAYVKHQAEIALVLMNMMMPVMDGATAIRTLQKINPDVKIIAVSGQNFTSKSFSDRHLNVSSFLAKPYTTQALLARISDLVSSQ